jgi:hypothetical protein
MIDFFCDMLEKQQVDSFRRITKKAEGTRCVLPLFSLRVANERLNTPAVRGGSKR